MRSGYPQDAGRSNLGRLHHLPLPAPPPLSPLAHWSLLRLSPRSPPYLPPVGSKLVEEAAGYRQDTRNLLAFPQESTHGREGERLWRRSSVLATAVASRRLLAVTNETIEHLAFPCCARGGECCPQGRRGAVCCSPKLVHAWLAHYTGVGGHDLQYYTRSQWFSNGLYTKHPLDHAGFAKLQLQQMRRPAGQAGFDAYVDDGRPGSWASCFNGSCYSKNGRRGQPNLRHLRVPLQQGGVI